MSLLSASRLALFALFLSYTIAHAAAAPALPRASFLGVQASGVTDESRTRLRLADNKGALVTGLVDGGSAKAAGLRADDVIVAVDGQPVADPGELVARIAPRRAGDRVSIRWIRDGRVETSEVVMRPRPLESGEGTRTEYSTVPVNGSLRRTIITGPADEATHPAVLYVTGIGCFSQESLGVQSTEAKLLHGLARAGFITMRVEKTGVGDSQGPACASPEADLRAEIAGYVEGLKALKSLPRVKQDRVFVVGLSIGGVEAPIIAQQVPVRGLVVVNTVAKPFLEYLLETRRRQNTLQGVAFDEVDRRQRLDELCNHALLVDRQAPDALLRARPECGEFVAYPAPYTFMQQWAALDLSSEWKRVDVPVLIVQGESDFVATVADAPLLCDIVESFHPGRASLSMIPAMDHYLTRAESMKQSMDRRPATTGEFEPRVLEAIQGWLTTQSTG
jgi:pimeloyl-ACP methyl ester carboxylesterase